MTGQQNRTFLVFVLILAIVAGVVTFSPKIKPLFGLDIKGGVRVVLRAKTEEYKGGKWTDDNLEAVRRVIENRVNGTGVAEPTIITKPPDQIVVELPGLKDEKDAIQTLQSTASLEFYWLRQLGNKDQSREAPWSEHDGDRSCNKAEARGPGSTLRLVSQLRRRSCRMASLANRRW